MNLDVLECKQTFPSSNKKKPIEVILRERLQTFADFLDIPSSKLYIAGGAITSLMIGETPRDWDFWATDIEHAKLAIETLANKNSKYRQHIEIDFVDNGNNVGYANISLTEIYRAKCNLHNLASESGGAIYYSDGDLTISQYAFTATLNGLQHQLVLKQIDQPSIVTSGFDFEHCKAYYNIHDGLVMSNKTRDAIKDRRLVYSGNKNAFVSLLRMKKFVDRGWKIGRADAINIVLNYLNNMETDSDQLQHEINQIISE